jgi:hypothetical protein
LAGYSQAAGTIVSATGSKRGAEFFYPALGKNPAAAGGGLPRRQFWFGQIKRLRGCSCIANALASF